MQQHGQYAVDLVLSLPVPIAEGLLDLGRSHKLVLYLLLRVRHEAHQSIHVSRLPPHVQEDLLTGLDALVVRLTAQLEGFDEVELVQTAREH